MKKPNLAVQAIEFVIKIKQSAAGEGQNRFEVACDQMKLSRGFNMSAAAKESEVITEAKKVIAKAIIERAIAFIAEGKVEGAVVPTADIGALKVSIRLPVQVAVDQLVEQSLKTVE